MQKLVWKNSLGNEIDLTSGNYGITEWEGFSNLPLNVQSQQVPFEDGGVYLDSLLEQRDLAVTLAMNDNGNLEERYRMRRELIHALNPKLGEGYLVYTNNFTSKRIKCVAQVPLFETHNSNDSGTPKASLAWIACDPYWEDLSPKYLFLENSIRKEVKYEGETETGVNIDLFPQNAENITIKNIDTGKEITINGEFSDTIKISTQKGDKKINKVEKPNYDLVFTRSQNADVCYAEEKKTFVLVGDDIQYSFDGMKWNLANIGYALKKVCFSKNQKKFCAVSQNNAYVSYDGIRWTESDAFVVGSYIQSVCFSEKLHKFFAVGSKILSSTDGLHWSVVVNSIDFEYRLTDVCESAELELLVATCRNGNVYYSEDGDVWNHTTNESITDYIYSITWAKDLELFCKVCSGGFVEISTDGLSWETVNPPMIVNWNRVIYSEGYKTLIAVGNGNAVMKSTDGNNWKITEVKIPEGSNISSAPLLGVAVNKELGIWVAVGSGGNIGGAIAYSINTEDWYYETKNLSTTGTTTDICYNEKEGYYLIVGDNGVLLKSRDLKEWEYSIYSSNIMFKKLIYEKKSGRIIALANNSGLTASYIMSTTNGLDWTTEYSISTIFRSLCYSEVYGKYFIAGKSEEIMESTNLRNWETVNSGANNYLYDIKEREGVIFAVGANNVLIVCRDGTEWEYINLPMQSSYTLHCCERITEMGVYVLCGNGIICISKDLENWEYFTNEDTDIQSIAYNRYYGFVMIVGNKLQYSYNLKDWNLVYNYFAGKRIEYANGEFFYLGKYVFKLENGGMINIIECMSDESDMSMFIVPEKNTFLVYTENGSIYAKIEYNPKYIGV